MVVLRFTKARHFIIPREKNSFMQRDNWTGNIHDHRARVASLTSLTLPEQSTYTPTSTLHSFSFGIFLPLILPTYFFIPTSFPHSKPSIHLLPFVSHPSFPLAYLFLHFLSSTLLRIRNHSAMGRNDLLSPHSSHRHESLCHKLRSEWVSERAQRSAGAKLAVRSERMSERCERTSERNSEWPSTLCVDFICLLPNVRWEW